MAKARANKRKPGGHRPTKPIDIATQEKRRQALEFRAVGYSHRQIAHQMGIPKSTIYDWCQWEMNELVREPAEDSLKLELKRLDILQSTIWAAALSAPSTGDWNAFDRVLNIIEKRARYNGVAVRVEHTGANGGPITSLGLQMIEATPSLARQLIREKFAQDDSIPALASGESAGGTEGGSTGE